MTSTVTDPTQGAARRRRLGEARLYLCTDGRRERGDLVPFLDAVLGAGVDVVQLREKQLEAAEELDRLATFAAACRRHGALLAVNDRADLAVTAGADVLHVGQRDLTPAQARAIVGPDVIVGRSTHDPDQAAQAAQDDDVDYFCTGPVWTTPTKPGRAATGLDLPRSTAAAEPAKPWFAIGGIDEQRLSDVVAVGASRVVVVRAITEATDPAAATRALRGLLTR
ncbi:MAG: thiamine phosphate synthase [Angustibacter sp.]